MRVSNIFSRVATGAIKGFYWYSNRVSVGSKVGCGSSSFLIRKSTTGEEAGGALLTINSTKGAPIEDFSMTKQGRTFRAFSSP